MPGYKVIYESIENIYGIVPKANDWVHYSSILKVKDGGKKPVSLEMTFVPPHPFLFNMPEKHSIRAESITGSAVPERITMGWTRTVKSASFFPQVIPLVMFLTNSSQLGLSVWGINRS